MLGIAVGIFLVGCSGTSEESDDSHDSPQSSLSSLTVSDNKILDGSGEEIRLRGVNIEDPYLLDNQDIDEDGEIDPHFENVSEDFQQIKEMGANVVRLTIVPGIYRELGESYLTDYFDQLVDLAEENSLYAIIDYHAIGKPGGWYPSELDETTLPDQTIERLYYTDEEMAVSFWEVVADRYGDRSHVIFDIYNEPADEDNDFTWTDWRPTGETLIATIRRYSDNLILAPGPYWTSDLSEVPENPYSDNNMAYAVHMYPGSLDEGADQEEEWENRFGFLAETYPVIVSEWGFEENGDEVTNGTQSGYAEPLLDYLNENNLHWLAYVYHPFADPNMVGNDWVTLTIFGEFVAERLGD